MSEIEVPEHAAERLQRIRACSAGVGVIGLGYVGLPLALSLNAAGFRVTGFDIDERKVTDLQNGRSYIQRITPMEIQQARGNGFSATADFAEIATLDVILICVPTPLTAHKEPDLSFVEQTAQSISPWLQPGQLVVLESTTYPGTTEEILIPLLEAGGHGLHAATDTRSDASTFFVAFSPEREDPGNTTIERSQIPKIVGGHSRFATEMVAALYEGIFARAVRVSSLRVAEMTKLLENIYRSVNIALVNELKVLSMRMGIDIWEVIDAASTKPFGFQPFYPGPGLGGHCIPIDPFYLSWKAREFDFDLRFIGLAGEINEAMPEFVVQQIAKALNQRQLPLNGSSILLLGVSYKKNIDDLRESPSLSIFQLLQQQGAVVAYNDPYHPTVGEGRHYRLNLSSTPLDHLEDYDCILIVTDHSDYDYADIVRRSRLVVDCRNATKGLQAPNVVRC